MTGTTYVAVSPAKANKYVGNIGDVTLVEEAGGGEEEGLKGAKVSVGWTKRGSGLKKGGGVGQGKARGHPGRTLSAAHSGLLIPLSPDKTRA